jgi:hypothetical protein
MLEVDFLKINILKTTNKYAIQMVMHIYFCLKEFNGKGMENTEQP